MRASEMIQLIDSIARDRNIDKELLFQDLEQAMVSAARKHFGEEDTAPFECTIDRITGQLEIWYGETEVHLEEMGRIPAQTAKQVIIQRFREEERIAVYNEFEPLVGTIVTGHALRTERGGLVIGLNRGGGAQPAEAIMPYRAQIPGERFQTGDRVRCLVVSVTEEPSQVRIVATRSAPEFITKLFELEVPELSEHVVEIRAIQREAGKRTKLAVSSIDSKIDAAGACIGVRGCRIRNVVDEVGGEKIDVVRWNDNSQLFIREALKPAEVSDVVLCYELGRATVAVSEDQLSLAIGKAGQNVRLAARLTGWDLDVLVPSAFAEGLDILERSLQAAGLSDAQIDVLASQGIVSVFDVNELGADYLAEVIEADSAQVESVLASCAKEVEAIEAAKQAKKDVEEQPEQSLEDILGGGATESSDAS